MKRISTYPLAYLSESHGDPLTPAPVQILQPQETAIPEAILGVDHEETVAEAVTTDAPCNACAQKVKVRKLNVAGYDASHIAGSAAFERRKVASIGKLLEGA